jgi:Spy/CpxP family protein refolding chaperone
MQAKENDMKKRLLIITLIVLAVGALTAPLVLAGPRGHRAAAGEPGFGPGMHGFGPLGHLAMLREELDLSDAQAEQIRGIFAELHEKNAPYREQLHGGLKSAAQALIANPQDVAAARAFLEQESIAERSMKENALEAVSRALGVLSADQRAKLATVLEEHAGHFRRQGRS